MEGTLFALLERVHGHLALLGLAVLVHPLLSLGRGKELRRGTWLTVVVGIGLLVPAFALGLGLYPSWRGHVKPLLIERAPLVAQAFELKEHLAWFTVILAVSALGILGSAGRLVQARGLARLLLGGALGCGLCTAALGIWIGGGAWPAW
jgi:hypothetical protein